MRHSVNKTNKYDESLCYKIYGLHYLITNKQNEAPSRTRKFNFYVPLISSTTC